MDTYCNTPWMPHYSQEPLFSKSENSGSLAGWQRIRRMGCILSDGEFKAERTIYAENNTWLEFIYYLRQISAYITHIGQKSLLIWLSMQICLLCQFFITLLPNFRNSYTHIPHKRKDSARPFGRVESILYLTRRSKWTLLQDMLYTARRWARRSSAWTCRTRAPEP